MSGTGAVTSEQIGRGAPVAHVAVTEKLSEHGVADTSRVDQFLRSSRIPPVATESVWLVRESGFNVYFASEAAAVEYGRDNQARVYEVPLFFTAESAAHRVIEGVDMDFFDKALCGDRTDPATGKRVWGYLDLRDGLANDPEWVQYTRLKEKFEPESVREGAGSTP